MKVIFTPLAERQIDELHREITLRSGFEKPRRQVHRAHCRLLHLFPERGTARDDLVPGLRTIGFESRVTMAFIVTPDAVLIEGIYYGGQDVDANFR